MQISYIILAHKEPAQLRRLILALTNENSFFYIHIDKNIAVKPFKDAVYNCSNVIFLGNAFRCQTIWGDIGIVKASLNAMKQIVKDGKTGFCILLSGQDYPVKRLEDINFFLEKNKDVNFISCKPFPNNNWDNGGYYRLDHYKFNLSKKKKDFLILPSVKSKTFFTIKNIGKVFILFIRFKFKAIFSLRKERKFSSLPVPYYGSQWWALPVDTIKLILDFINLNPDYLQYHEYSLMPDEIFFQTIVESQKNALKGKIADSLTYVDWTKKNTVGPTTFKYENLAELAALPDNILFARKFDLSVDIKILDAIDAMLIK